jgi:hypothetical protein
MSLDNQSIPWYLNWGKIKHYEPDIVAGVK